MLNFKFRQNFSIGKNVYVSFYNRLIPSPAYFPLAPGPQWPGHVTASTATTLHRDITTRAEENSHNKQVIPGCRLEPQTIGNWTQISGGGFLDMILQMIELNEDSVSRAQCG